MPKCKLIIKCLYDAQAQCSCGKWYYVSTGERTKAEIKAEYKKHLT